MSEIQTFCPLCHQPLPAEVGLRIYAEGGKIILDQIVITFSPDESLIFNALHHCRPKHMKQYQLLDTIMAARAQLAEEPLVSVIRTHVRNINKRLNGTRMKIVNEHSYGYRLDIQP